MSGPQYAVRMFLIFSAAIVFLGSVLLPIHAVSTGIGAARVHRDWDSACDPSGPIAASLACGGCVAVLWAVFVLPIALTIGISVWIYNDARRRGDPNAALWMLLGLLLNVIGWIVYLIVRQQPVTPAGPVVTPAAQPPSPPPPPPAVTPEPPAPPTRDEEPPI